METTDISYNIVCFGEVLWDILPTGPMPGGAPMNVAYHLQQLGCRPALISRTGNDQLGKMLLAELEGFGLSTAFIQKDAVARTGHVFANPNGQHEMEYDIVYPAAWDFINWQDELKILAEKATYLVFGSLASRHSVSCQALEKLLTLPLTKVLDLNIRQPWFSKAAAENLLQKADIVKLNMAELELVSGWYGVHDNKEESIRYLCDHFRLEGIVVTMGGDGAILYLDNELFHHPGYQVQVADTVGSGDAFLAGLLCQLFQKQSPQKALDFAYRLGALVASHRGACPSYALNELTDAANPSSIIFESNIN